MSPSSESFWGEMAPCEHLVQIYDRDDVFLDSLEGFVTGGLRAGDGVIIIAMQSHRAALEDRIRAAGIDLEAARANDQYIDLDAGETLGTFMRDGWPDEKLFALQVGGLLARAGYAGRRVRAFGEMVAILWAQGHNGATVRLEHLWHDLCQNEGFSLFCAYPKAGFTKDVDESIREICAAHSRVVTFPSLN